MVFSGLFGVFSDDVFFNKTFSSCLMSYLRVVDKTEVSLLLLFVFDSSKIPSSRKSDKRDRNYSGFIGNSRFVL